MICGFKAILESIFPEFGYDVSSETSQGSRKSTYSGRPTLRAIEVFLLCFFLRF